MREPPTTTRAGKSSLHKNPHSTSQTMSRPHFESHSTRSCAVCGGRYQGKGWCANAPRCPRGMYRPRHGPDAFDAAKRKWEQIVRARSLWRKIRVWFWTGQAVKVFELHLQRIRAKSAWRRMKRRALGVNEGRKRARSVLEALGDEARIVGPHHPGRLEGAQRHGARACSGPEVENAQRVPPPRRRWLAADSRDSLRGVHAVAYRPGSDNQSNFPSDVTESSP